MTPLSRRRFLTITAAAMAAPAGATPVFWQGNGMGGTLSIRLDGVPPAHALRIQSRIAAEVAQVESLFSLYRDSALTRLNRDGVLANPAPAFLDLCALADRVNAATNGMFDPTVQALWQARATGADDAGCRDLIGWNRVAISPREIRLPRGMALTFNGIAQGMAADRIATLLRKAGLEHVLIDMGETATLGPRADGTPWRAQVQGPDAAPLAEVALAGQALATSSPMGTRLPDGSGHILHPTGGKPVWATVAVLGPTAALADALATAFCLMDGPAIEGALAKFEGTSCAVLQR
jgi:thiamine biosynthesis lipoprotein